jgi:GT2 family glycosyltransferase
MDTELSVDVVIAQYGNWDVTERCLDSLRRRDRGVRSVIVVDDASPDDAAEQLRGRENVVAVLLEENHGFAGACNAGAALATADTIFFLNSDTIVPPGAIALLAAELARDPTIGAVGPRLLYADGTVQGGGGGLMGRIDQLARIFQHLDGTTPQVNVARDEIAICGAALLIRRDLFEKIGRFDEGYKVGYEDIALGLEVWAHGLRCRYVPDATIVHLEGCSRGRSTDETQNVVRFRERWEGKLDAVPRYLPADPPSLAIRWHDVEPVDALVRTRWQAMLREHAGARVTFTGSRLGTRLARVRAAADRRALVRVAYDVSDPADARWIAPRDRRRRAVGRRGHAEGRGDLGALAARAPPARTRRCRTGTYRRHPPGIPGVHPAGTLAIRRGRRGARCSRGPHRCDPGCAWFIPGGVRRRGRRGLGVPGAHANGAVRRFCRRW